MNQRIKTMWTGALCSGEYLQGYTSMRIFVPDEDGGRHKYCCLGVLADLYRKEHDVDWDNTTMTYGGANAFPSESIASWAEMINLCNASVEIDGHKATLSEHNDAGASFDQIADAIDTQL